MNRILLPLAHCQCERRQRCLELAQAAVDRISQVCGDVIEADAGPHLDPDDHHVRFYILTKTEPTEDYAAAHEHLAWELRRIFAELSEAAEMLEGGAA